VRSSVYVYGTILSAHFKTRKQNMSNGDNIKLGVMGFMSFQTQKYHPRRKCEGLKIDTTL